MLKPWTNALKVRCYEISVIFYTFNMCKIYFSSYIRGPAALRRQSNVPWSDSGWFWLATWWTRTMEHCLWLASGSWIDGLGHRFLRPGKKKMVELLFSRCSAKECILWLDDWLCSHLPLQPPGPFSSEGRTGFGSQAVHSSQTSPLVLEQASAESACRAWLDPCRSLECEWKSL